MAYQWCCANCSNPRPLREGEKPYQHDWPKYRDNEHKRPPARTTNTPNNPKERRSGDVSPDDACIFSDEISNVKCDGLHVPP